MVCPVTEPMYYGENSAELTDTVKTRRVYLPEATAGMITGPIPITKGTVD